jgi:hypothetical protein
MTSSCGGLSFDDLNRLLLVCEECAHRLGARQELPIDVLAKSADIIRTFVEDSVKSSKTMSTNASGKKASRGSSYGWGPSNGRSASTSSASSPRRREPELDGAISGSTGDSFGRGPVASVD